MVIFTKSDPWRDGNSSLSDPLGDEDDLGSPPVTPRNEDDLPPLTPLPDLEHGDRTDDLGSPPTTPRNEDDLPPLTPLQELEPDEDRTSAIQPVPKKRYGKQKDNGTGDQETQDDGDEMQPRAAKQCKPATPAEPQASKTKPKPKPVSLFIIYLIKTHTPTASSLICSHSKHRCSSVFKLKSYCTF